MASISSNRSPADEEIRMVDVATPPSERERQIAEIVAYSERVNNRERERRMRYLLSALSTEQLPHPI
jgi:hypothetical protein